MIGSARSSTSRFRRIGTRDRYVAEARIGGREPRRRGRARIGGGAHVVVILVAAFGQLAGMALPGRRLGSGRIRRARRGAAAAATRSGSASAGRECVPRLRRAGLGGRRARHLVHGLAQVVLELVEGERVAQVVARAADLGEALAEGARELRQPLRTEDQQCHHDDHHQLHRTDAKHAASI